MNITNTNQSMSSKDIAILTGKEHKHVLRDIRIMLDEMPGSPDLDSEQYQVLTADNGMTAEILLNKRLTYILITGYSVQLRTKVVDRWQQLEQSAATPTLTDPALVAIMRSLVEIDQAKQLAIAATEEASRANRRLDQIETAIDHYTVVGWSRLNGYSIPLSMAARMGQDASRYCALYGIAIGKVPDARHGTVNSYPKSVLDHLFSETVAA